MKPHTKRGLGFGLTSGIITTLGVLIGLYSSTHSKLVVLGGILSVAIADAFSDALGMHISEEASNKKASKREIWETTFSTLIFKFIFAGMFIIPLLLFELQTAVLISILLGISLLTIFSYSVARNRKSSPLKAIAEHVLIAVIVIVITYSVGRFVSLL